MGAFVYNSRDGMAERYTSNGGYYVTGTELNDTIVNGGYYDSSNYYSLQADLLHRGDNVNINGWEGSDEILNHGDKVYIDGGTGNDSIKNHWGRNVTICGGKDDDTIICEKANHNNQKELILYEPGDGNDVIYNFFDDEGRGTPDIDYLGECIYIGTGDMNDTSKVDDSYFDGLDFVLKIGDGSITLKDAKGKTFEIQDNYNNGGRGIYTKVKVLKDSSDTTPGSDETLSSEDDIIYGTKNDDTLENSRDKVKIEALAGNDDITNNGKSVTINGGNDKDSVKNFGSNTKINSENGNDWIYNENANKVTIDSGSGNDYISNGSNAGNAAGSDISIDSGEGDDTIWNAGNNASIKLGKGKDKIENYGNKATIDSGEDNDTILNYGTNVSIKAGNGDDTLSAETGESSTLYGEAGNDVISLYDTKTKVFGGKGDDIIRIESLADKTTVNGDEDSDTFVLNLSTQNGQSQIGNSAVIQDYESGKDKIVLEKASIASHFISDFDVILTLKSENISDYKLTLKNAKDKEITITDSDGKTTTQIYREETSKNEDEEEPYWTLEDLETLIDAIDFFLPIPIVQDVLDTTARVSSILNSVIAIEKKEITDKEELTGEAIKVASDISAIIDDVKSLKGENSLYGALNVSALDCIGNWISTLGIDKNKLNKDDCKLLDSAVESTNDLAIETFASIAKKIGTQAGWSIPEINYVVKRVKFVINFELARFMIAYEGHNQLRKSIEKYSAEELPFWTMAEETFVDVIAAGIHGGLHQLTRGLDDLTWKAFIWIKAKLSGEKLVKPTETYTEFAADGWKILLLGSTNSDDIIEIKKDNEVRYAQGGNDYIRNIFSNVKIYGGDGNDTIFSHKGSQNNYLNGNDGRDFIITYGESSTLKGANGNDKLASYGNNNYISGDTGIDFIFLKDTSYNTVTGGKESDIIALENAQNTLIYYSKGDGGDIIFGYDESDTIRISGKAEYTLSEEEQDICIKVGSETIILKEAKGKDIKIENRNTDKNPLDDIDPFNQNPIMMTQIGNLNLRGSESPQAVSLSGGNQTVQFNDKDGNIAIIDENATGRKNIIFGKGDDLGVFTSPNSNVKVAVGSGYDSIVVDNNARVNVDMAKASDAIIIANNSKVTLTNYNASSNAGVLVPNVDDIANAVKDNSIQLVNNEVLLDSSTSVKFNDKSNDSTIVNLITDDGEIQKVGFTNSSGGELNTSKFDDNFVLKGNYAESSSDKQKRGSSIIIAGKGFDTILAGARDVIDGGNGKNQIYLTPYDLRSSKDGATIATSGNGRNIVYGFHDGLDYDSDCIKIGKLSDLTFKFESDGLLLNSGDSRLKFDGIGIDSSYSDNSEYLPSNLNADEPELILLTDGSSTVNAAIAQTNQSVSINSNDLETPNAFFGNRSGLNFSDFDDDLNIDLAKGIGNLGNTNATFKGINKLQAGNGKNSLIGSNDKNTLIAGNGYNSIWSGANNDKMIGKSGSEDKDGSTTFFFLAGDEHDIIANFEFINEDNKYDDVADKIDISNNVVTDVYHSGDDIVLQINDSSDYLTIKDAYGKDFRINNLVAKVDKNIAYDGLANYYVADGGSSLTVDSSIGSAEIWLDNSHGTTFIGNISKLDASAVKGETSLVGNEFNNTIIAGQGDSSMWGGSSNSNDMLIGGESCNTFFYCLGNGNDTITGINNGDRIILSTVTLDQITGTNITAEGVSINFADGSSLQINGTANITYQLADASRYSANHERLQWEMK